MVWQSYSKNLIKPQFKYKISSRIRFSLNKHHYDPMDLPGQQLPASNANTPIDHVTNLNINSIPGCQRLTGIMALIGHRNYNVDAFEKMMAAGMNIANLSMSFGSTEDHLNTIEILRKAADKFSITMGRPYPLGIAIRLSGRKIKTGRIADNHTIVELIAGDVVRLTTDETYKDRCSASIIFVDFKDFAENMKPGDIILLEIGTIALKVDIISSSTLTCKVQSGGILGSYDNVFTPNVAINLPHYSAKDEHDINMAINNGVNIIVVAFVNSAETINAIRKLLGEKGKNIALVANIQQAEGLKNIDEILKVADGVMLTRQELGMDMKADKLVLVQKNIIARARQANIPVMLNVKFQGEPLKNSDPLRSEFLDLGNLILDGVDCLRFSPELVSGMKPELSIELLSSACKEAEACRWSQQITRDNITMTPRPCEHATAAAIAGVIAAQRCLASVIIVITANGRAAKLVSKYEPRCPIVAVTRYEAVAQNLHLFKGIIPLFYGDPPVDHWPTDQEKRCNFAIKFAIDRGFVRVLDPIVIITGWRRGVGYTNTMRVTYVSYDS